MLKRILPFFLTLAVGLFIASFFVDLKPQPFAFPEGRRARCRNFESLYYQEHDRAERLQQQLDQLQQNPAPLNDLGEGPRVYPAPFKVPPPPPPPAKIPSHVVR
jgi:hypothetical protein